MATASVSEGGQLSETVAKHYNELKEAGLEERTNSRIFYLRNLNNWIKSMLISDFISRIKRNKGADHPITVLDLCGGKGGDLLKWRKGNIHSLVLADIAGMSVAQAEDRYKENQERNNQQRHPSKMFTAQFITADCTKDRLRDMYADHDIQFGLTSCQFSFHYSFESYAQADMMVRNACENLRPGGYFIGTTPDANQLVKRLRASDSMSFGNDVYRVTFHGNDKDKLPLFGAKYDFHLEGVVDCPEFLVHFPALEKIAEKYGMQLILQLPFSEFFKKHHKDPENRGLLGKMQSLEPYPPADDVRLMASEEGAYKTAQEVINRLQQEGRGNEKVGTLSAAEWEATTIYMVFAFQKINENTASEPGAPRQSTIPQTTEEQSTEEHSTEATKTDSQEVSHTESQNPEKTDTESPVQGQKRSHDDKGESGEEGEEEESNKRRQTEEDT